MDTGTHGSTAATTVSVTVSATSVTDASPSSSKAQAVLICLREVTVRSCPTILLQTDQQTYTMIPSKHYYRVAPKVRPVFICQSVSVLSVYVSAGRCNVDVVQR